MKIAACNIPATGISSIHVVERNLQRQGAEAGGKTPCHDTELLFQLAGDIESSGPVRGDWPNYSKLSGNRHHCHLKKGHPCYVAVWTEDRGTVSVEINLCRHTRKSPLLTNW